MPVVTNNKPNNLNPPTTNGEKGFALGTMALNSGLTAGAPLLERLAPGTNPTGAGGLAVTLIGNGVLVIVQGFAAQDWFDDYKYAVWIGIVICAITCAGLYIFLLNNPELGVLNTFGAIYQFATNYGPLSKLGVFSRPGDRTEELVVTPNPQENAQ